MRGLTRSERRWWVASAVVVALAVVAVLVLLAALQARVTRQDERLADEVQAREEQAAFLAVLDAKITEAQEAPPERKEAALAEAKALSDIGQAAVAAPARGEQGRQGERGEAGRAPTLAEVEMGVLNVLSQHPQLIPPPKEGPRGATGDRGKDAPPPTVEQLRALIASVVADMLPQLRGPAGEPGKDGAPGAAGKDGTPGAQGAPGADAPPPTQEQVTAGVAAVIAANPDLLPAGPKGDTGPPPASFTFAVNRRSYVCGPTALGSLDYSCQLSSP